jgi:hypothetical protein
MTARFIQVDLEIEAEESLAPICEDFARFDVFELHHSRIERGYFAGFELWAQGTAEGEQTETPDDFIAGFCSLIEQFGPEARACWDGAFRKTFDIGYECTGEAGSFASALSPAILAKMAGLGVSLGITIYPLPPEDPVVIL